jgi:hypothetical protein
MQKKIGKNIDFLRQFMLKNEEKLAKLGGKNIFVDRL